MINFRRVPLTPKLYILATKRTVLAGEGNARDAYVRVGKVVREKSMTDDFAPRPEKRFAPFLLALSTYTREPAPRRESGSPGVTAEANSSASSSCSRDFIARRDSVMGSDSRRRVDI